MYHANDCSKKINCDSPKYIFPKILITAEKTETKYDKNKVI